MPAAPSCGTMREARNTRWRQPCVEDAGSNLIHGFHVSGDDDELGKFFRKILMSGCTHLTRQAVISDLVSPGAKILIPLH
jgi:hypothetical protein